MYLSQKINRKETRTHTRMQEESNNSVNTSNKKIKKQGVRLFENEAQDKKTCRRSFQFFIQLHEIIMTFL